MITYAAALALGRAQLSAAGIDNAALDARLLMSAAACVDMAALISRSGDAAPDLALCSFRSHIDRRLQGEPVARILGEKEFWGLPFKVNAATLVPRPDTETLVEAVLAEIVRRGFEQDLSICDLGTGSGAVLIALLTELPHATGSATDISTEALAVARENAERHGVAGRITFRRADFAEPVDRQFDVIVSNPPYIPAEAIAHLPVDVRGYDPHPALDGGADGLSAYRAILGGIEVLLARNGFLAFEVGHDQARPVAALCRERGLGDIVIRNDLAGVGRVVLAGRH